MSHGHLTGAAKHAPASAHAAGVLPPCTAIALTGVPAREQLYNGTLCDNRGAFADLSNPDRMSDRERNKRHNHNEVRAAVPVILDQPEFFGRVVAQQALQDGSPPQHDTIFAVSDGAFRSVRCTRDQFRR